MANIHTFLLASLFRLDLLKVNHELVRRVLGVGKDFSAVATVGNMKERLQMSQEVYTT